MIIQRSRWMPYLLLLSLATSTMIAPGAGFDLHVHDVSGLNAPWPMVAGLPFPEGALRDPSSVRILSGNDEIPVQLDAAATWRDGSLRWILAGFNGNPQAAYRVEFGSPGKPIAPSTTIRTTGSAAGQLRIDTGEAVYEFLPNRLMPERVRIGNITVIDQAGDGAYLVDNCGRMARVAGEAADIDGAILKTGPLRVVVRRSGNYVTPDGVRLARANVWFYFSAGQAGVRITHSLVLTEDTNDVWIRDYGLDFTTPACPNMVTFALGPPEQEERLDVSPAGGECYMLQEVYPHFMEEASRTTLARITGTETQTLRVAETAGDWADARYAEYGLTLVVPWLAQQFPKEIAFGPHGARVALWSGRSGREMDFRAATLVQEYWGRWIHNAADLADSNVKPWINTHWEAERKPVGAEGLAKWPSNAQGAARTHDVWLLPRRNIARDVQAHAHAAARPPLVLADPAWLCSTRAIGWPMHPKDVERFPRMEEMISRYWEGLMAQFEQLPRTGFIAWGANPYLTTGKIFRYGILADYGLRRSVWGLYGRSGERRFYDYGTRFNRHIADWWVTHWTAGNKFRGGFTSPGGYWEGHMPFIWGDRSTLDGDSSGHDVHNWLLEYYLTGDEYPLYIHRMIGETTRARWDAERVRNGPPMKRWEVPLVLRVLASFYEREWNEEFATMAHDLSRRLIDLDNPNGLTDKLSGGALYKWERNVHALYEYYRVTGDTMAKQAILKALDYHYRFNLVGPPFHSTNHGAFLYTIAYTWTGRPGYLRLVNHLVERSLAQERLPGGPHTCAHPTMGVPTAMTILRDAEPPPAPFPLAETRADDTVQAITFEKRDATPVSMSIYVRMSEAAAAEEPTPIVTRCGTTQPVQDVAVEIEDFFRTTGHRGDPRRHHIRLTVPAGVSAGDYELTFPHTEDVMVLDSTATVRGNVE